MSPRMCQAAGPQAAAATGPAPARPQALAAAQRPSSSPSSSRRQALVSAAALALGSLPPMPAAAADAAAQQQLLTPSERGLPAQQQQLTPYERGLQQVYGLQQDGRVRPCMTDANPNCVGTASRNSTYMPAWEAPQGPLAESMAQLEAALREEAPEAVLVESASGERSEYRRWAVKDRLFDRDDIEVVISLQQPPYERDPPLVTFRSMAAQVRYVWPIQQPITDGSQRERLKRVRRRLNWRLVGCDLLECYEE